MEKRYKEAGGGRVVRALANHSGEEAGVSTHRHQGFNRLKNNQYRTPGGTHRCAVAGPPIDLFVDYSPPAAAPLPHPVDATLLSLSIPPCRRPTGPGGNPESIEGGGGK